MLSLVFVIMSLAEAVSSLATEFENLKLNTSGSIQQIAERLVTQGEDDTKEAESTLLAEGAKECDRLKEILNSCQDLDRQVDQLEQLAQISSELCRIVSGIAKDSLSRR